MGGGEVGGNSLPGDAEPAAISAHDLKAPGEKYAREVGPKGMLGDQW